MFKFVVLFVLFAVAAAKPSSTLQSSAELIASASPSTVVSYSPLYRTAAWIQGSGRVGIHEPTLAKVGDYVESVPTAVSHQSATVVHNRANLVRSIYAPVVQSHTAPALHSYGAPLAYSQAYSQSYPLVSYYSEPHYYGGHGYDQVYKSAAQTHGQISGQIL